MPTEQEPVPGDVRYVMCETPGCVGRPVALCDEVALCSVCLVETLEAHPGRTLAPIVLPRLRVQYDEILTPAQVEEELVNLLNRQEDAVAFLTAHQSRLSELQGHYDDALAAARLVADGSDTRRRDAALVACSPMLQPVRIAKVIVGSAQDRLKSIHYEMDVWRSIGASVRNSLENASRGGQGNAQQARRY